MTQLILNIGLNVGNSSPAGQLTHSLKFICELFVPSALRTELRRSLTENTLIVELETDSPFIVEHVDLLCRALNQDAIAYTANGEGHLVGPRAADWGGAFNPAFFLAPSWSPREHADCYYDTERNR